MLPLYTVKARSERSIRVTLTTSHNLPIKLMTKNKVDYICIRLPASIFILKQNQIKL